MYLLTKLWLWRFQNNELCTNCSHKRHVDKNHSYIYEQMTAFLKKNNTEHPVLRKWTEKVKIEQRHTSRKYSIIALYWQLPIHTANCITLQLHIMQILCVMIIWQSYVLNLKWVSRHLKDFKHTDKSQTWNTTRCFLNIDKHRIWHKQVSNVKLIISS